MFFLGPVLIFLLTLLFVLNWQKHSYWKSKRIPTPTFYPILGHFTLFFFGPRWDTIDKIYKKYKSNGFWGMYLGFTPEFYVSDLELVKNILVKDTEHFANRRGMKFSKNELVLNEMLIYVTGEKWKALRSLLSTVYTSGKMKTMYPLIAGKGDVLLEECDTLMAKNSFVEMKSLFTYYTMDVIATCAFGFEAECLKDKEDALFMINGRNALASDFPKLLKSIMLFVSPKLYYALGLQFFGSYMQYFIERSKKTIDQRLKTGFRRGDILDMLIEAYEEAKKTQEGSNKYPMTRNTLISESVLFLFAGFETSANTLALLAYLLAKNPDIQIKLRDELNKIKEADGELNYDNIMKAEYLDACMSETLRFYSPAYYTERRCTKTYITGKNVVIPEGMMVEIPIYSIHHDPEYWPEPYFFRPERFLPENKGKIVPYSYLPFGLGPRNCLGIRFAMLEAKLAISKICLNYEMKIRPGYEHVALENVPIFNTLRPNKTGIHVVLEKIHTI